MSFRKRLKNTMRGKKSKSHRLLAEFRARMIFSRIKAILSINRGLFNINSIKNTKAATKEEKIAKSLAIASCVIETYRSACVAFDTSTKPI